MKNYAWVRLDDKLPEEVIRQHFSAEQYPNIRGLFYSQSRWANQQQAEYEVWYKLEDDAEEEPTGLYFIPETGVIHDGSEVPN